MQNFGKCRPDNTFRIQQGVFELSRIKLERSCRDYPDPHSPSKYRVWGPLMSFAPFYAEFNIKQGDKMFVVEKIGAISGKRIFHK